jgi:hypothetical protein
VFSEEFQNQMTMIGADGCGDRAIRGDLAAKFTVPLVRAP